MRNSSLFCSKIVNMLLFACVDLYYIGCIAGVHYRKVGRHLIIVYSWPYAGKNYLQACNCGVYKGSICICIRVEDMLLLLYV